MIGIALLAIAFIFSIAWLWAGGIEYMKRKHPNYKGEDFLNWDQDTTKIAGRDSWDDNLHDEIN